MSDCACVCVDLSMGVKAEFMKEGIRRARTTHICTECCRAILPGEKYEYTCGLWEGRFSTTKTCADCLSIRDNMFCAGWCYGCLLEDLRIHVEEVNGEVSESCLAALTPRARATACGMIEEAWEKQ